MSLGFMAEQFPPPSPSYGLRALEAEAAEVAGALVGSRSHVLNRAAFSLGQLVVSGDLDADLVEAALLEAASDSGLLRKNGRTDVLRTINRAMQAGELKPRERKAGTFRPDPRAKAVMQARAAALRRAEAERIEEARKFCATIWRGTTDACNGAVEAYLASRGLDPAAPPALRFHPVCPSSYDPAKSRPTPAMVALVQAHDASAIGLHVTPIMLDGSGKAPGRSRLMFGSVGGGAVRLAAYDDELAVAEGIETASAFTKLFGAPCWAVLSTSGLRGFVPPQGLRRLIIAADRDDTGDGMVAARVLAERARAACEVVIAAAPMGQDWNDALKERGQ